MIYREKIQAALQGRRADFADFQNEARAQLDLYLEALNRLAALTAAGLLARLEPFAAPGALPTDEFDRAAALVVSFPHAWRNHEEARAWAYETLLGRTTFAADGSQILPSKDLSVPVAAVQVGWFENPHTPDGHYVKDVAFEVLSPADILVSGGGVTEFSERAVERRRFGMEVEAAKNYMLATAARGVARASPPVVFFDASLIVSFATFMPEDQRDAYVAPVTSLLATSRETFIPVVGYVDGSSARDLVNMLQAAFDLPDAPQLTDAALLAPRMKWGDRTPLYGCARQGILDAYGEAWRRGIGFVYLKTAGDLPPSRLDIPLWVAERGLLDYVVDTVRAEVVVGNGYPYAIEAADATAVLSARDREVFYAMFQEFADRELSGLRVARKAISKAQRR